MNKETDMTMKLNPYFKDTLETSNVVWSHDENSYQFNFDFTDYLCKNPVELMNSHPRILLEFLNDECSDKQIYPLIIDSERLGQAHFIIPYKILGYVGDVKASLTIDFDDKSHDLGSFYFRMKKSPIDDKMPELQFWVDEFDQAFELFKHGLDEFNEDIKESNAKVDEIKDLIVKNDVLKKVEAGPFGDFREWDDTLIAKMKNEFESNYVNVEWFGAMCDGKNDDTLAINKAIKYANENGINTVVINNGVSMIKAHVDNQTVGNYLRDEGGIEILDNITLHIKSGAKLKAITNDKKAYNIIRAHRKKYWKIIVDGEIEGDNDRHTGTQGEWGYGISVQGGSDFTIEGTGKIYNCWGDGINLQRAVRLAPEIDGYYPSNGNISGVICDKNGRQGMSIEEGKDIYVKDSTYSNTNRIAPRYGICIEPAWRNKEDVPVCENITIDNCRIIGNLGGGVTTVGTTIDNNIQLKNIVVKNCYFEGNGINASLKTSTAISGNRSDLEIVNCIFKDDQSIYVSSCENVNIFNNDLTNGTVMILSDSTSAYDIRTNLNFMSNSIKILNGKTNTYSSVFFTALKGEKVNIYGNDVFYNGSNPVIMKFSGDTTTRTKEVLCSKNTLVGGSTAIQHQFVDVFKSFSNTIIDASSQAFNSNGYETYFKGNEIINCQKGIFTYCNNDKESTLEVKNNKFDVKDSVVLTAYQPNKLFKLFNLGNESPNNAKFSEPNVGNAVSDDSVVDVHNPQIVTVKNQTKADNLPVGTLMQDLNTGWIVYKAYNGLHRVTTTKI